MKMWKKMKKDVEALSPVVATLLIILVTVGAVSALYIWESSWQKGVSSTIGNQNYTQGTVMTLTGSTTVTDLMNYAVPAFMSANPGLTVSVNPVGSGAGLTAIEQNKCDIGMISNTLNNIAAGTTTTYPALETYTVAYDGVSLIIGQAAMTFHNWAAADLVMNTGIADSIYHIAPATPIVTWGDLETAMHTANNVLVFTDTNSGLPLNAYWRSDSSGTQDCFYQQYLACSKAAFTTGQATLTGSGQAGNPALIAAVLADKNGIGFGTAGMVSSTTGAEPFAYTASAILAGGILATPQTVMDGVLGLSTGYPIWHPLNLITNGVPSALDQQFIQYVLDKANNVAFCASADFTSIYQTA